MTESVAPGAGRSTSRRHRAVSVRLALMLRRCRLQQRWAVRADSPRRTSRCPRAREPWPLKPLPIRPRRFSCRALSKNDPAPGLAATTMNDHTQCPACHCPRTHVTKGEFKASGFQAFGNRLCDRCGTAWRPRCPRWAAILSIFAGCAMLGGILAISWPDLHRNGLSSFFEASGRGSRKDAKAVVGFVTLVVVALGACFYGIAVLCGQAGKMEILGKLLVLPPGSEISEPDSGSVTDMTCAGCQRPIPPGSAYCPHCGLRQRS